MAQFDSFKVKFSLLESKNAENEAKIGILESKNADNEAKIRSQAGEINQLKVKFGAKQDFDLNSLGSYNDERNFPSDDTKNINLINIKENTSGESSTRAIIPASCRELALIGHSLDGLYLVKNPDTRKIETVLCDFGTSSKF